MASHFIGKQAVALAQGWAGGRRRARSSIISSMVWNATHCLRMLHTVPSTPNPDTFTGIMEARVIERELRKLVVAVREGLVSCRVASSCAKWSVSASLRPLRAIS